MVGLPVPEVRDRQTDRQTQLWQYRAVQRDRRAREKEVNKLID